MLQNLEEDRIDITALNKLIEKQEKKGNRGAKRRS